MDRQAGALEIEITPEMIAAGAGELVFDSELVREDVVYDILVAAFKVAGLVVK